LCIPRGGVTLEIPPHALQTRGNAGGNRKLRRRGTRQNSADLGVLKVLNGEGSGRWNFLRHGVEWVSILTELREAHEVTETGCESETCGQTRTSRRGARGKCFVRVTGRLRQGGRAKTREGKADFDGQRLKRVKKRDGRRGERTSASGQTKLKGEKIWKGKNYNRNWKANEPHVMP